MRTLYYAENKSLRRRLSSIVGEAFQRLGCDSNFGEVVVSKLPELGQFTCPGAFFAAKALRRNPKSIAEAVIKDIAANPIFRSVSFAGAGYINMTVSDEVIVANVSDLEGDPGWGCGVPTTALRIIVDFGGPNVAKPLHVGHLRSAIIGESLKRICRQLGHEVLGDVHLGDWGLQMGMLIYELKRQRPDLPYFSGGDTKSFPDDSPVSIEDLEVLYPMASERAKNDDIYMSGARQATAELQQGRLGYRALWQHFVNVSITSLKEDYSRLGVEFDLWMGESSVQQEIPILLETLRAKGLAYESEGALVVDVAEPLDDHPMPPLLLQKTDGAALYSTTDLATIAQRMRDYHPDLILYVVDNRQQMHFKQVFRCARKAGIAPETLELEHIGFGTMNGKDGKPFKTRAGGTMKLGDLIQMVSDKACERIEEAKIAADLDPREKQQIAKAVGIATLKFADLSSVRTSDYVFDLDKFSAFEGKTGPYLLYMAVRAKSILRKARQEGLVAGTLLIPQNAQERTLLLKLTEFSEAVHSAFQKRSPSDLCDYSFDLCTSFSRFYRDVPVLNEENAPRRASYLKLCQVFLGCLTKALELLGIDVPERM
jgi:arginyl-tRNA synthetase